MEPVGVAAQSVAEATGTATTAGVLSGSAPAMTAVVPMGAEEVSVALATAIQAHNAQFLAQTGVNVADRGMFASDVGLSGVMAVATEAVNEASLLL
ncbi:PE domain-containing protein [Mycolicibacterium goodii]|uniref:PE domain-containing protein n=1 Tax=Mycolicibacterium goodii TaxID=134601 RepID=UPI001BDD9DB5|nr:PE domain-containing protein [Mycolicibacterium goodii]MBU8841285.1 PE domain-containing protein [Mycolicibacterium goodii]